MLNDHGFDLWSDSYDESVKTADESNQYPFAGYTAIMNTIYGTIMNQAPVSVLDVGFGTAMLASKLYDGGNTITGLDFSAEMLKIASSKMPEAKLLQWDFTNGLPPVLNKRKFDFIVSTYALHHLTDEDKAVFIRKLPDILASDGAILIGDVCFHTIDDLLSCKKSCGDGWDDDEFYFVLSELRDRLSPFCRIAFHKFSFCSGIIEIRKS